MFDHMNLFSIGIFTYILKLLFISMCTFYTFTRIINIKKFINYRLVLVFISTIIINILTIIVQENTTIFYSAICLILLLSLLYAGITKNKVGNSILITTISLASNYIVFFISSIISFLPNLLIRTDNEYFQLLSIIIIDSALLWFLFKFKRFKNGFAFLQSKLNDDYFDILILNLSVIIIFLLVMLTTLNISVSINLIFTLLIFTIVMIITVEKTITMYYKHKLLVNELEDTKKELENKKNEINELEKENLNFSKISHSIAHKQKALEYKINELMLNSEIASELDVSDRLREISNEYTSIAHNVELSKTGIDLIDDMFKFMQAECIKNNIDFELKLSGNIHHMVNNFVSKEDLEILIADHVKNAIIAVNNSNNINRSILVKLGMIDRYYSLYVYDSGIEFEIDTLLNLGIKPSSTHVDDGGTGMGFMNTFDTLNKTNASILINEIGKTSKENYTKSLAIIFNKQHKYSISSYRADEIKEKNNRNDLILK